MNSASNGDIAAASAQREELILGMPQRIATRHSQDVIDAALKHTVKLRSTSAASPAPVALADIPEMAVTLLGCHPELYERIADVSVHLMAKTNLPRRDLELVVLRTDWLCQSPFNWGEHVRIAKRFGITSDEIEDVTVGSTCARWSNHDRCLLKLAEELHKSAMVSDETWTALAKQFDDKQMFELVVLVGQFTLITYVQNALRLRVAPGNEGLRAR